MRRTVSCVISSCNAKKNAVRGSTTISGGFSVLSVDGKLRNIVGTVWGLNTYFNCTCCVEITLIAESFPPSLPHYPQDTISKENELHHKGSLDSFGEQPTGSVKFSGHVFRLTECSYRCLTRQVVITNPPAFLSIHVYEISGLRRRGWFNLKINSTTFMD